MSYCEQVGVVCEKQPLRGEWRILMLEAKSR